MRGGRRDRRLKRERWLGGDFGPSERHRHDCLTVEEIPGRLRRARIDTQTPLDRYRKRGEIGDREWQAGDMLRELFYLAGLEPSITLSPDRLPNGSGFGAIGPDEATQRMIDARRRWRLALRAVGSALSPILIHVACQGQPPAGWALARGWPGHHGLPILKLALDALADYYRLGNVISKKAS